MHEVIVVLAVSALSYTAVIWLIGFWTATIIYTINSAPRSDQRVVYPPPYAVEVIEEEVEPYPPPVQPRARQHYTRPPPAPRECELPVKAPAPRKASPPNYGSRGRVPYGTKVYGTPQE